MRTSSEVEYKAKIVDIANNSYQNTFILKLKYTDEHDDNNPFKQKEEYFKIKAVDSKHENLLAEIMYNISTDMQVVDKKNISKYTYYAEVTVVKVKDKIVSIFHNDIDLVTNEHNSKNTKESRCIILESSINTKQDKALMRVFDMTEDKYKELYVFNDFFHTDEDDDILLIPKITDICDIVFNEYGIPISIMNINKNKIIYEDDNKYVDMEVTLQYVFDYAEYKNKLTIVTRIPGTSKELCYIVDEDNKCKLNMIHSGSKMTVIIYPDGDCKELIYALEQKVTDEDRNYCNAVRFDYVTRLLDADKNF